MDFERYANSFFLCYNYYKIHFLFGLVSINFKGMKIKILQKIQGNLDNNPVADRLITWQITSYKILVDRVKWELTAKQHFIRFSASHQPISQTQTNSKPILLQEMNWSVVLSLAYNIRSKGFYEQNMMGI